MSDTDQKLLKLKKDLDSIEENKENSVRRSPRMLKTTKTPALSPVNKSMRISTLKKSVQKKVLFQNCSPRSERLNKAKKLYNSLRQEHPLLKTPFKFKSGKGSETQGLSETLQQQCLMLQDTPAHK